MTEEIRHDDRRKVTAVGNSWIVCKSKSHPGHIYYFNSLTGEAAWNLSDAEIEKAKYRTKHLEPASKPVKCPEPKDNPPSALINSVQPNQSLFNKEFVINRISKQQSSVLTYSNFPNNNAAFGSDSNQMSKTMPDIQINNSSLVKPMCNLNSFNSSMSAYNYTTPTIYNPKVWDIPMQQVFIPAINPIVNHNPGILNVAYNQVSGNMLNTFNNKYLSGTITRAQQSSYERDFNCDKGVKRPIFKKNGFTNKNDLRQQLFYKKKYYKVSGTPGGSGTLKTDRRKTDFNSQSTDLNKLENIYTKGVMENRCGEMHFLEPPSKIDLTPLKRLAPSDSNLDAWFIVVDLEVLLNEFKYLTTLTDSDEKCHLMVPKCVMEELKTHVTSTENIQARRILRFLSQQIEIQHAYIAEEPPKVEGDSMADVIHTTCKELLKNKYHLILITDDSELLSKNSSDVNIFCIDEIKNLLTSNSNKPIISSGPKKKFFSNEFLNKIKITVPTDSRNVVKTIQVTDIPNQVYSDMEHPTQNVTHNEKEEFILRKNTCDAGIQTDFEDINTDIISISDMVQKESENANNSIQNDTETEPLKTSETKTPNKKREIKLKRSISKQPTLDTIRKKQFKWRRRRNPAQTNELIISRNDENVNKKKISSPPINCLSIDNYKYKNKITKKYSTVEHIENKISENSIESRESSICNESKISGKENVTIEETSTSGIISNTESSVDAESNYSISTNIPSQQLDYNGSYHSKPMYQVDSITMEQYLTMKCDEWTSRFIQIMEEVLSQVLQQDPPFEHDAMPPPWTLHEAAQCIAIKFSNHENIKCAANKLSNILFRVSDAKGKITMNMTPYQYMQMYSYGVHLLAAIMEVTKSLNCEDIQLAVESLNKLLLDIRNPNMDSSTNDTFIDNVHDNLSFNDVSVCSDVTHDCGTSSVHEQEMSTDSHPTEANKIEPITATLSKEELQKPVKFVRNIDIEPSFFKSFYFQKNTVTKRIDVQDDPHGDQSQTAKGKSKNANATAMTSPVNEILISQPNVIRKFSKCPGLEQKLKRNFNFGTYENHDDDLDYEEYDECTEDQYYSNENSHVQHHNDENHNETDNYEPTTSKNPNVSLLSKDSSKEFRYVIFMLLQEIRQALLQVQIFCDQCYKELKKTERSTRLISQLEEMAERAHLHILCLCGSLERMLDHKTSNPTQSMANLLKQADINLCDVDAELLFEYKISVTKCKDLANDFLNSILNIISEFKK